MRDNLKMIIAMAMSGGIVAAAMAHHGIIAIALTVAMVSLMWLDIEYDL